MTRLDRIEIPGEHEARERAWRLVEAAFVEREPAPVRRRRLVPAIALAVVVFAVAAAFTPPGEALVDRVREAIGVEPAEQALFSLPAPGRLLVVADSGAWAVSADGAKRRLGGYVEAGCSPFGRFLLGVGHDELAALEPDGEVRWKLARRDVHEAAWTGGMTDTRIAYLSRGTLRVVAGDGTGDHAIGPADRFRWLPGPGYRLAIVSRGGMSVVDADTGAVEAREPPRAPRAAATLRHVAGTSQVRVRGALRFEGTGRFRDLTRSPNGRWLAFVWPEADQLVFVTASGRRSIQATANLTAQFESASLPRLAGWCPLAPS